MTQSEVNALFAKYSYYARSALTLLTRLERPGQTLSIFLGRPGALPAEVRLRGSGWRFMVRTPMDVWIVKETCVDRDYLWGIGTLAQDWNVIDIGAGLGDFTVLAARLCPGGTVHAYEPLPDSYAQLQRNVDLNNVTNARTFAASVASHAGTLAIESTDPEPVRARTVAPSAGLVNVAAVSLGEAVAALPRQYCDLLKVDCEGREYDILMHSPAEVLGQIQRISLEYHDGVHPHRGRDLADYLQRLGYRVRQRGNQVHDYLGYIYAERM